MMENKFVRKKAKNKMKKEMLQKGNEVIKETLDKHESKQDHAINRNNMIGEDFRSQALNNYYKILDLKQ